MARAIDVDKLLDDITAAEGHGGMGAVIAGTLKRYVMRQPILTPPNEPMTLEQLREMDGEPVWIVDVGPHKWYGPGWAIVDRDNCLVRTVKNWNAVFFESYGERWLAYRRPPEVLAISQAIVYGHCDKCGFLPQCSTQGEAFQFPVFAWCMRRKAEILADMQKGAN